MTNTITSTSGTKAVKISNNDGSFYACYVQYVNTGICIEEQLITMKGYNSEKAAIRWANRILN